MLAHASLRVRVMAAAAILVTITSVVMGSLGTALLRGYLIGRADQQLAVSRRWPATGWPARAARSAGPAAPAVRAADPVPGRSHRRRAARSRWPAAPARTCRAGDSPPPSSRARGGPFTTTARGEPAGSWRVADQGAAGRAACRRRLQPGLDLNSTVIRLEIADAAGGAGSPSQLLAGIGLLLVRISLSPLRQDREHGGGDRRRRPVPAHRPPAARYRGRRLAEALNAMLRPIEAAYRAREEGEAHARDSEERMRVRR